MLKNFNVYDFQIFKTDSIDFYNVINCTSLNFFQTKIVTTLKRLCFDLIKMKRKANSCLIEILILFILLKSL